ncbi:MAG TPA: HAD family hydrolase [Chloroflexota bacterium]|nr:HAD family hydrolase [Chloroflexota bacterium]
MDAVIFDVGGVLLVPHAESVSAALEPLGIVVEGDTAERAHYAGIRALDASPDEVLVERRAYLEAYARAVGVGEADLSAALTALRPLWNGPNIDLWRQPVRGSVEGLRSLAATGIKLGIVSNADGSIEEQLRRGQICQVGEGLGVPVLAIVDSHVVGVAKPAAEIFRHALDPLGVAPSSSLYVGDTVRYDVRGARAAGLQPLHFDPYQLCPYVDDHPHAKSFQDIALIAR